MVDRLLRGIDEQTRIKAESQDKAQGIMVGLWNETAQLLFERGKIGVHPTRSDLPVQFFSDTIKSKTGLYGTIIIFSNNTSGIVCDPRVEHDAIFMHVIGSSEFIRLDVRQNFFRINRDDKSIVPDMYDVTPYREGLDLLLEKNPLSQTEAQALTTNS